MPSRKSAKSLQRQPSAPPLVTYSRIESILTSSTLLCPRIRLTVGDGYPLRFSVQVLWHLIRPRLSTRRKCGCWGFCNLRCIKRGFERLAVACGRIRQSLQTSHITHSRGRSCQHRCVLYLKPQPGRCWQFANRFEAPRASASFINLQILPPSSVRRMRISTAWLTNCMDCVAQQQQLGRPRFLSGIRSFHSRRLAVEGQCLTEEGATDPQTRTCRWREGVTGMRRGTLAHAALIRSQRRCYRSSSPMSASSSSAEICCSGSARPPMRASPSLVSTSAGSRLSPASGQRNSSAMVPSQVSTR